MNSAEKVAYLKGLLEGMGLDKEDKNAKILYMITDVLEELTIELEEVAIDTEDLIDIVEELDEDLGELEEVVMDILEDEDDESHHHGCGGGHHHGHGHHHHHHEGDDDLEDLGPIYETICPSCEEKIYLDEELLMLGKMDCPGCGELLEFGAEEDENSIEE